MRNIHKKTPALESLFKIRLQHSFFPLKIAKFLRMPILKKICKWMLLKISCPLHPASRSKGVTEIMWIECAL